MNAPEPVNFCSTHDADDADDADETNDARWEFVIAVIFALLATPAVCALARWLLPIVWGMK